MAVRASSARNRTLGVRGQSMVEFALVAPLLLALLIGILEFGRMVFVYASVTNASREAVRFASAIGFNDTTYNRKYQYCSAIRTVAKRYGFLLNLQDSDIEIQYDQGPGTTAVTTKCAVGMTNDPTVVVQMGRDRVKVVVSANYSPMTKFIPIPSRTFIATSYRTILGFTQVGPSYP